jgi:hypothetical protein
VVHGHGLRTREVVVLAAVEDRAEIVECWVRRYRCTKCRAVMVVLPRGVMPRYLYSAAAVVMGLFLVADEPVGEGCTEAQAYAQQGMYAKTRWTEASPYRWRSLGRWAAMARRWWPNLATGGVVGLLVALVERSGTGGLAAAAEAAVSAHVLWGRAM